MMERASDRKAAKAVCIGTNGTNSKNSINRTTLDSVFFFFLFLFWRAKASRRVAVERNDAEVDRYDPSS
jgi:hypothetical protein